MRAFLMASGALPPSGRNGSHTTISSRGMPILLAVLRPRCSSGKKRIFSRRAHAHSITRRALDDVQVIPRSEEHTSELQSRGHLVCRLLLEKKKKRMM